jgi:hypothetical protein
MSKTNSVPQECVTNWLKLIDRSGSPPDKSDTRQHLQYYGSVLTECDVLFASAKSSRSSAVILILRIKPQRKIRGIAEEPGGLEISPSTTLCGFAFSLRR